MAQKIQEIKPQQEELPARPRSHHITRQTLETQESSKNSNKLREFTGQNPIVIGGYTHRESTQKVNSSFSFDTRNNRSLTPVYRTF